MTIEIRLTDEDAIEYMRAKFATPRKIELGAHYDPKVGDIVVGSTENAVAFDYNEGPTEWKTDVTVVAHDGKVETFPISSDGAIGTNVPIEPQEPSDLTQDDIRVMFGKSVVAPGEWDAATQAKITVARQQAVAEAKADAIAFPTTAAASVVPVPPPTIASPGVHVATNIVAMPPELDKDGIPWDGRIHSSTKGRNKDGTWRVKRGVDDAFLKQVTGEYRQLMAIPAPGVDTRTLPLPLTATEAVPALSVIPNIPVFPVIPPPPPVAAESGAAASSMSAPPVPATVAPPVPSQVPAVVPIPAGTATSASHISNVGDLIAAITAKMATKQLTKEQVDVVCAKIGIPTIGVLGARPDLIFVVVKELGL